MGTIVGLIVGGVLGLVGLKLLAPKRPDIEPAETQQANPIPPRIYGYGRRRLYGALAFWGNATDGSTVDVIAFHDGKISAVQAVYVNDDLVTISGGAVTSVQNKAGGGTQPDKYRGGVVKIGYNLGANPETAHAAVSAKLGAGWGANFRGDGVASGYIIKEPVREKDFNEVYPQGDNAQLSLVADLQFVFDFRDGGQSIANPATWTGGADNPVLILCHYLTQRLGYDYATQILPQIAAWTAAADVCDETISSEKRYRCWMLYDSTKPPSQVIQEILDTFDGWYCENENGELVIYAGEYYAPTVTIDADQIVEYELQTHVPREDVINEITNTYISSAHDYQVVDASAFQDSASIAEIGIQTTKRDPQVPSHKQTRRLSKIFMTRNNTANRGVVVTNYAGRVALGQRFITLEIIEAGSTVFSGVVEVQKVTRNSSTFGLTIEWIEAEAAAWDWNPASEDGDPAATGTYPVLAALSAPTIDTVTPTFGDNSSLVSLLVEATGPARSDLTWFARVREAGDSAWSERRYDDLDPTAGVEILIPFVSSESTIEIQVAYKTGAGQISPWSTLASTAISVDDEAPATPATPTLEAWTSSIHLSTTAMPRARSYIWSFYQSDGTTLKGTVTTTNPEVFYTLPEAQADGGALREYKVSVQASNGAGSSAASSQLSITKTAPAAPTGISATGGAGGATITYTPSASSGVVGNVVFVAASSGFDPATTGIVRFGGNSGTFSLFDLATGTFYFRMAALDGWTSNPSLLNLAAEGSFTTTADSGGFDGSGGGGSGGGWSEEPIFEY